MKSYIFLIVIAITSLSSCSSNNLSGATDFSETTKKSRVVKVNVIKGDKHHLDRNINQKNQQEFSLNCIQTQSSNTNSINSYSSNTGDVSIKIVEKGNIGSQICHTSQ